MRVVHATPASVYGGLFTNLEGLVCEQARRHRVLVAAPIRPRVSDGNAGFRWVRWQSFGNSDWRAVRSLQQLVLDESADVLLLHAGTPGECAVSAMVLSVSVPTILIEQLPSHYYGSSMRGECVLAACKRRASRWVSVSSAGARSLERRWHLPAGSIITVHNGTDPPSGSPYETVHESQREPVVMALGPTETRKGFDTFSQVATELSGRFPLVRWRWFGGDLCRLEGCVEIEPWRDDVGSVLSSCKVLLVPSRAEGLPLVLLEAWSCGTPVVASSVGGIPEVVRNGVDGVLVPPDDIDAWVESVGSLLASPEDRARIGAAGHARWASGFTAAAMAERYETLIEELVRGG